MKNKIIIDEEVFKIFEIEDLQICMKGIREIIHPIWQHYGGEISNQLVTDSKLEPPIPVHLAQHRRRSVYAPESTWVAIGGNTRGYKKFPHFQILINVQYVFVGLALIDNPLYEKEIAAKWQKKAGSFQELADDFVVIPDHTQLYYIEQSAVDYQEIFERLIKVKKAEFMLGRKEDRGSKILSNEKLFSEWIEETIKVLIPFYFESLSFYK
ncbi:DUF1054 family protein [Facklamia sp. DSM 111018]|uniref:DUF1054 family protein n=1 Tax=Facklamia lactis TaxID=2749967 RepID=A0ABS0LRV3_9LACT|nr:DUF1054 family protein [Facklamia lactis]MBG9980824.1 DUF1054 family protein [Facklamia lactis]MBG9986813.1 DUF1054 family protein [Facklamia lactis]